MSTTVALNTNPQLRDIVRAAFPAYRKRDARTDTFSPNGQNINSYWDGGSRDEYAVVHVPTLRTKPLPTSTHPYFDVAGRGMANNETADVVSDRRGNVTLKRLPPDFVLVRAGTFCGKAATATVYFPDAPVLTDGK